MRKALAAAVLGSLVILASPTPASAHAELESSSPRNGAVTSKAPTMIALSFSEPAEITDLAILDSRGQVTPSRFSAQGARVTVTPAAPLAPGPHVVQWKAVSDDGHAVSGAIAFIVGKPTPRGRAQALVTSPKVATVLSGSRVGQLSVRFTSPVTSGQVEWSNPAYAGPFTWRVTGDGRTAQATGILPSAGTWTMRATLVGKGGTVIVTNGAAHVG